MLFVVIIGLVIIRGAVWITQRPWTDLLELLVGVAAFVIIALLESGKALFEKYEENNLAEWTGTGVTRLDELVGKDRPAADRLVRQQVSRELEHIREILTDTRSRIYRTGQEDFAVKIRKLESKVQTSRDKGLKADFGQPPYVSPTLNISRKAWDTMLDYDEDLLLHAAALTQAAASLQQKIPTLTPTDLETLEAKLDAFMAAFAARARTLQPPQA
jgi:hypothetical protein